MYGKRFVAERLHQFVAMSSKRRPIMDNLISREALKERMNLTEEKEEI